MKQQAAFELEENADLSAFHTLALKARCRYLVKANSLEQLLAAVDFAHRQNVPYRILGSGSNVVFASDYPGLIVLNRLSGVHWQEAEDTVDVTVAAGENWHQLVMTTLDHSAYGLENLALIPGTAGAAPVQNIGAYGVELEQFFVSLTAWDHHTAKAVVFQHSDCRFAYRYSVFREPDIRARYTILSITLRLGKTPKTHTDYAALFDYLQQQGKPQPTPRELAEAVIAIRQSKLPDPAQLPNAGSFFKNPLLDENDYRRLKAEFPDLVAFQQPGGYKVAAAWLIDRAGWKGRRQGAVGVHQQQALVLVNYGGADGAALMSLAADIQVDIHQRFGVSLDIEPDIIRAD